jgi:hypothetical protein
LIYENKRLFGAKQQFEDLEQIMNQLNAKLDNEAEKPLPYI